MLTDQQHPITPPPELTDAWKNLPLSDEEIFVIAARWGADQELEACIEWMRSHFHGMPQWADELRSLRRPKPPSLAEQALALLDEASNGLGAVDEDTIRDIRRALKRLQELENNG